MEGAYSSFLVDVGEHDDAAGVLLPHHSPEVVDSVWEGTLCCYVQSLLLVALSNEKEEECEMSN